MHSYTLSQNVTIEKDDRDRHGCRETYCLEVLESDGTALTVTWSLLLHRPASPPTSVLQLLSLSHSCNGGNEIVVIETHLKKLYTCNCSEISIAKFQALFKRLRTYRNLHYNIASLKALLLHV